MVVALIGFVAVLFVAGCGSNSAPPAQQSPSTTPGPSATPSPATPPTPGAKSADPQFCAHNLDPACPRGSHQGPFVSIAPNGGHWDGNGQPVKGGPVGADGSTGNNLTQEYCARNQDPGCPVGSYVGSNAVKNPDASNTYVVCEGTICTNPNHGAGDPPGTWGPDGQPTNGGPMGADGSTGNNLTHEYCARNQDPACPVGSFVAPNAIENPDGSNSYVVCEGTICTNPNHGGGDPNTDGPLDDNSDTADVPPGADTPPPPADAEPPAGDAPPADDGGSADDGTGQDAPPTEGDSP
jgi:hypothetical protein